MDILTIVDFTLKHKTTSYCLAAALRRTAHSKTKTRHHNPAPQHKTQCLTNQILQNQASSQQDHLIQHLKEKTPVLITCANQTEAIAFFTSRTFIRCLQKQVKFLMIWSTSHVSSWSRSLKASAYFMRRWHWVGFYKHYAVIVEQISIVHRADVGEHAMLPSLRLVVTNKVWLSWFIPSIAQLGHHQHAEPSIYKIVSRATCILCYLVPVLMEIVMKF